MFIIFHKVIQEGLKTSGPLYRGITMNSFLFFILYTKALTPYIFSNAQ